jgi:flagellar biosynthetic protein FliS
MANHRPAQAYEQVRQLGMTRVDLILAVFDGIVRSAEQAMAKLQEQDDRAARELLARARIGLSNLAGSTAADSEPLTQNFFRLYRFAESRLAQADPRSIAEAVSALKPLREAFEAVRTEARELERGGALPPLSEPHAVRVSA